MGSSEEATTLKKKIENWTVKPKVEIITSPKMIEFMLHLSIEEEKRKRAEGEIGFFEYFKDRVEDADNILSVVISNFIPDGKNKKYTKEKKSKKKSKYHIKKSKKKSNTKEKKSKKKSKYTKEKKSKKKSKSTKKKKSKKKTKSTRKKMKKSAKKRNFL